jgi:putative endonuclease
MKQPAVYVMASGRRGTLYGGVTADLVQRVWQHREGTLGGLTQRYGVKELVWYEPHGSREEAIAREKALKKWRRAWKLEFVKKCNPQWRDLWDEIVGA